jgi:toxin ParE1/3/4
MIDLAEIWAFIADDSAGQADTFASLINSKFELLAGQPNMGRSRPELAKNIPSLAVGHYVIFYLPVRDGVQIVRVIHGARDIEAIF